MKTRLISLDEVAHELGQYGMDMTTEEVLVWLREHGYLVGVRCEVYNRPSDLCLLLGYMVTHRVVSYGESGKVFTSSEPRFTEKGRDFILPKLLEYARARKEVLSHV